jgi:hypothetical protein
MLYLLEDKARFFPQIWHLNVWGCLKFAYEVPNYGAKPDCSEPDHAEPNQGLHRQIIMFDFCSSELLRRVEW